MAAEMKMKSSLENRSKQKRRGSMTTTTIITTTNSLAIEDRAPRQNAKLEAQYEDELGTMMDESEGGGRGEGGGEGGVVALFGGGEGDNDSDGETSPRASTSRSLSGNSDKQLKTGGKVKDRETKSCGVCGDKALGFNFDAISCESCKAFFRRNANKSKEGKCLFAGNCNIDVNTRRFCQYCRLKKCFEVGMKKEWILSDEDKIKRREKILTNKFKRGTFIHPEMSPSELHHGGLGDEMMSPASLGQITSSQGSITSPSMGSITSPRGQRKRSIASVKSDVSFDDDVKSFISAKMESSPISSAHSDISRDSERKIRNSAASPDFEFSETVFRDRHPSETSNYSSSADPSISHSALQPPSRNPNGYSSSNPSGYNNSNNHPSGYNNSNNHPSNNHPSNNHSSSNHSSISLPATHLSIDSNGNPLGNAHLFVSTSSAAAPRSTPNQLQLFRSSVPEQLIIEGNAGEDQHQHHPISFVVETTETTSPPQSTIQFVAAAKTSLPQSSCASSLMFPSSDDHGETPPMFFSSHPSTTASSFSASFSSTKQLLNETGIGYQIPAPSPSGTSITQIPSQPPSRLLESPPSTYSQPLSNMSTVSNETLEPHPSPRGSNLAASSLSNSGLHPQDGDSIRRHPGSAAAHLGAAAASKTESMHQDGGHDAVDIFTSWNRSSMSAETTTTTSSKSPNSISANACQPNILINSATRSPSCAQMDDSNQEHLIHQEEEFAHQVPAPMHPPPVEHSKPSEINGEFATSPSYPSPTASSSSNSSMTSSTFQSIFDSTKPETCDAKRILTEEDNILLSSLTFSYDFVDLKFAEDPRRNVTELNTFINQTEELVKRIIKFAKKDSLFQTLLQADQIALLKGSVFSIILLRSVIHYDPNSDSLRQATINFKMEKLKHILGADSETWAKHIAFLKSFHVELGLDKQAILLVMMLVLFSPDHPGVKNRIAVASCQERYMLLTKNYIESVRSFGESIYLFPKVLGKIGELRSLTEIHAKLLATTLTKSPLEPLMVEIFDMKTMAHP